MELPPLGGAVFIFFSKNRQQVKMPLMKNLRVFLAKIGENNVCGKNPLRLAAIAIINKNIRK